jgi:acetyl/propionyl-CoA carboxylase alpha subunit/acetyl-CoA carboxylase carboxyltransferase component
MESFRRIAILNRGEAAMRLIHAARELRQLRTIALFTEPDRRAMFVRQADESHFLGGPGAYLDLDCLADALRRTRSEAAWVGWGFVAENAAFADLCARLGVVFIGPSGDVMRRLGDKISAKRLAEEVGVPVAAWSGGPVDSVAAAREQAGRLGFPLLIKASAGGGGRGIRRVTSEREVADAFTVARAEAQRAFGDPTVFMEQMIMGARHVEVQVIADRRGTVWALGTRDCSIQRRNQKLLEEAPAGIDPAADQMVRDAAISLTRAAGYENAGTVEFLFQAATRRATFMEVNTRLQVEHPVTELTTGVDLVKLQLHIAAGGRLEGAAPATFGHAIEVRLCAEDPDRGFAPAPGTLERFSMPSGPGIRVDTGYDRGDVVPADFDSMIAKIIAGGRTRDEALARLRRALVDTAVVVRGGATNKGFLLELLARPEVVAGELDTGWLDRLVAAGAHVSPRGAEVALIQAAIEAYEADTAVDKLQFARSAARGRPAVTATAGCSVELSCRGQSYELVVRRLDAERYLVEVDGRHIEAVVEPLAPSELRLTIAGQSYRILSLPLGTTHLVEVDGLPHRVVREGAGVVRAPSPAVVVSVAVKPGDLVAAGDRLVTLEAMKCYIEVAAEQSGRVREVLVLANTQVGPGKPLLVIEAEDGGAAVAAAPRARFDALAAHGEARCALDQLRSLVLGYDVGAPAVLAAPAGAPSERWGLEDDVLETFVDLLQLFRRQSATGPSDVDGEEDVRAGPTEHFFAYLRDLSGRGEGVPPSFIAKLRRALAHYGVGDLERTPALHESLFRICKARQRLDAQVEPLLALLQRRIDAVETDHNHAGDRSRELLDRLIAETHGRLQALNDGARELRFLYFERAVLDASRQRVFDEAGAHLAALVADPPAVERRAHLEALARSPHPLLGFLTAQLPRASPALRHAMSALLLARYYRLPVDAVRIVAKGDGVPLALAAHAFEGRRIQAILAHVELGRLDEALRAAAEQAATVAADDDVHLDIYAWHPEPLDPPDVNARRLVERLNAVAFPRRIRGVVVGLAAPGRAQHFTFRPDERGIFVEQTHLRGLHPMVARRMQLWRLARFELERLPSAEEIFLFRAVARENASDERLIALAAVRDLTPMRDRTGRVVGLPHLERVLGEALAAMRFEQTRRPPRERLYWNRVQLYLEPPLLLSNEEVEGIVRRLAPAAAGLGLEHILVGAQMADAAGVLRDRMLDLFDSAGSGITMVVRDPPTAPMEPLSAYTQKVVRLRQQGLTHPYEILEMLAPRRGQSVAGFPPGEFVEHDLGPDGELAPVERAPGENRANVIVGVIRNFTAPHPEGMARVVLLGDPSKEMGSLAEPECRRIVAALALARRMRAPVEWFALSAGAKIAMDSGTENMDWIAMVLRRIIELTQEGGEINVIVDGINVGAQPYWNAEATMLMHTRGILVMTDRGAMVLTGKRALDFSGGVSADDNFGIGGYERVMGPNGQAQYYAEDLTGACRILLDHYEHTYVAPGERHPRRALTSDPIDRSVLGSPHARGAGFATVGDVFSDEKNPGRKQAFDIRSVLQSAIDQDHPPLERWFGQRGAEVAVVWDAHLGGWPVCLLGIESRPLPRLGLVAADGPDHYTAGTLFPIASKKIARAINAASGNRPVVVLANLSGFDGSPESMRDLQLEYGAEIGRAVVNFRGPLVFCVVSRYHGGAFVVFSAKLNDGMEVVALEGSYASVIGGAPAAAVVFAREVDRRARKDPRLVDIDAELARADGPARLRLKSRREELWKSVYAEILGRVADEFDRVHSVERAQAAGSVHRIIAPATLRPYLVDAIQRGFERERQGR